MKSKRLAIEIAVRERFWEPTIQNNVEALPKAEHDFGIYLCCAESEPPTSLCPRGAQTTTRADGC